MEEIADRAKVSKPVVYEHFGGKEGLYAVIVDREMDYVVRRIVEAIATGSPRERVEQASLAFLNYVKDQPDGFAVLSHDSPLTSSRGRLSVDRRPQAVGRGGRQAHRRPRLDGAAPPAQEADAQEPSVALSPRRPSRGAHRSSLLRRPAAARRHGGRGQRVALSLRTGRDAMRFMVMRKVDATMNEVDIRELAD